MISTLATAAAGTCGRDDIVSGWWQPEHMQIADHIAVLRRDGIELAEVALRVGLDAEVPTCPGWQLRDLLGHLGAVHRWAASYVAEGRVRPCTKEEEAVFFAPPTGGALVDWFREGHRALVETLSAAPETVQCWTFLPAPSPLAFWARRQAHETAIHRADAESATAAVPQWDPAFAADGIDELLNGFFNRRRGGLVADPARSMAVVASDIDAAWTMHIEPDRRRIAVGRQPADLTVTGPVGDLYLLLWNRGGAGGLELYGDRAILDLWRSRATVKWR